MTLLEKNRYSIPTKLNIVILFVAALTSAGALWVTAHSENIWVVGFAVLFFAFSGNTLFSLLHEAVHGILHPNQRVNDLLGLIPAAFFPTGLLLQRCHHLTHHKNNRTRLERFDYIHTDDIKWLKYVQWYIILTGLYWAFNVLGTVLYLFIPQSLRLAFLQEKNSVIAKQTASGEYLRALDDLPPVRARLEILFTFGFQALLFWGLDLRWDSWLMCYAAFGLNWSSLQYADHAFSSLDRKEGAWNLRVNPVVRAFFLNYHFHLVHHLSPQMPWIHLPKHVDESKPMPRFLEIWLQMWKGPRPVPQD